MTRQILLITGDAGESFECLYASQRLRGGGIRCRASRRRAGAGCTWSSTTSSRAGIPTSSGPGYGAESDLTFDEARPDDYEAILVLGGRAPEYLRHDPRVLGLVRAFDAAGKWVFAICHGVQVLAAAGVIGGKRVTAYEHCRWEIEACGATYVAADQAVRDGRIVTGQTWQSHPEFYRHVFACLGDAAFSARRLTRTGSGPKVWAQGLSSRAGRMLGSF